MKPDKPDTEYEFYSYDEMENKLRELDKNNPNEIYVTIRRVMSCGRYFVEVEEED